jgi:hypothetical protein
MELQPITFAEAAEGMKLLHPSGRILVVEKKDDLRIFLCVDGNYEMSVSYYELEFDPLGFKLMPVLVKAK